VLGVAVWLDRSPDGAVRDAHGAQRRLGRAPEPGRRTPLARSRSSSHISGDQRSGRRRSPVMPLRRLLVALLFFGACSSPAGPGVRAPAPERDAAVAGEQAQPGQPAARGPQSGPGLAMDMFQRQMLEKQLIDLEFYELLGDEMVVRKVRYAGADDMIIPAYLFAPKDTTRRYPALIMIHGGIHGDFDPLYVPHIRSLVHRGYVIVAPEYRGSTGYGREHYDAIDYGGKEVEDCIAARDFLEQLVPYADTERLGIIGWSHGGFITLHAIFRRPELFKVAVAHVPVTDLPTRIRTHSEGYHRLFSEQRGFGARLEENPKPYIERSPVAHVRKLQTPLLVHAADNDDDVFIIENRNLRDSMVVAGKDRAGLYTYKEYHRPPGGHEFNRVDTPQGRESWEETVAFLNRFLQPRRALGARTGQ
jgi:dienelactone hydrolase